MTRAQQATVSQLRPGETPAPQRRVGVAVDHSLELRDRGPITSPVNYDKWREEVSKPGYAQGVVDALRRHFSEGRFLLEPCELLEVSIERESDGTPVLRVVYSHGMYPYRLGLRTALDSAA